VPSAGSFKGSRKLIFKMATENSLISVIVCTKYRSADAVLVNLAQIKRNIENASTELILVDGNGNPKLKEMADRQGARYVYEPRPGIPAARNAGIASSKGDIVAFTDDDCFVETDWIKRIADNFRNDPQLVGLGGVDYSPPESSVLQKAVGLLDEVRGKPQSRLSIAQRMRNCNSAYRKRELLKYGAYNSDFYIGEDYELNIRLVKHGCKLAFDETLIVYHERVSSIKAYWKKFFNYGFWSFKIMRYHPNLFLRTNDILPPATLMAGLLCLLSLLLGIVFPIYILLTAVLLYAAFRTARCMITRRELWRYTPIVFGAFIIRNLALGLGFYAAFSRTCWRKMARS